jgi:hypothetical protein
MRSIIVQPIEIYNISRNRYLLIKLNVKAFFNDLILGFAGIDRFSAGHSLSPGHLQIAGVAQD